MWKRNKGISKVLSAGNEARTFVIGFRFLGKKMR